MGDHARAGDPAASTDGQEHDIDIGKVFDDFKACRSHARYEFGFINRVDVAIAFFCGEPFAVAARFVEIGAVEYQLSSHGFY